MELALVYQHTVTGDVTEVKQLTKRTLAQGVPPGKILNGYLMPAMEEEGGRFEREEYYIPDLSFFRPHHAGRH